MKKNPRVERLLKIVNQEYYYKDIYNKDITISPQADNSDNFAYNCLIDSINEDIIEFTNSNNINFEVIQKDNRQINIYNNQKVDSSFSLNTSDLKNYWKIFYINLLEELQVVNWYKELYTTLIDFKESFIEHINKEYIDYFYNEDNWIEINIDFYWKCILQDFIKHRIKIDDEEKVLEQINNLDEELKSIEWIMWQSIEQSFEKEYYYTDITATWYSQWDSLTHHYLFKIDNEKDKEKIKDWIKDHTLLVESIYTIQEVSFLVEFTKTTQYYDKEKNPTYKKEFTEQEQDIIDSFTCYNNHKYEDLIDHIKSEVYHFNTTQKMIKWDFTIKEIRDTEYNY